ncbi:hypothetical protein [Undibacterium sp. KW1]|uniref:hypothetical protein n=1 Tax=Undibacterium sp. KW1 TaxID=2058624 RepID=UPI0013899B7A|nr:hypothetical protein [Undibacterium sp. KW1]
MKFTTPSSDVETRVTSGKSMSAFFLFGLTCCLPSLAMADDWSGFLGLLIVLFSLPVAAISLIASLVLVSKGKFRQPGFFIKYAAVFTIVAVVLVIASYTWNDRKSLHYAFIGESILLLIILLPGFIQYLRRHRYDEKN